MNICSWLCGGATTNRSKATSLNTFLSITRHSQKFGVFFFAFKIRIALGNKPPAERHKQRKL